MGRLSSSRAQTKAQTTGGRKKRSPHPVIFFKDRRFLGREAWGDEIIIGKMTRRRVKDERGGGPHARKSTLTSGQQGVAAGEKEKERDIQKVKATISRKKE